MNAAYTDHLDVERSGGFGGLTLRASVPLSELSQAERAAIDAALRRSPAPPSGPDRFMYRFRMRDREALVQEDSLPAALRPLVDRLRGSWH